MIVLGDSDFVLAMRLLGVSECHEVYTLDEIEEALSKRKEQHDIMLVNTHVAKLAPDLIKDPYVAVIPQPGEEMRSLQDLQQMMVESLGISLPQPASGGEN